MARRAALLLAALCFICSARADPGTDTWAALQEAIDRAGDGEVITLSRDLMALEMDAEITVSDGKRLTLDLNGHVLDSSMEPNQTGRRRCVINIREGAILTLMDSGGTGVLTGGFHDNGGDVINRGTLIMAGQEGPQAARQRAAHHLDVLPGDKKGGKQKALQPQKKSS